MRTKAAFGFQVNENSATEGRQAILVIPIFLVRNMTLCERSSAAVTSRMDSPTFESLYVHGSETLAAMPALLTVRNSCRADLYLALP